METIYIADKSLKELENLFMCNVDDDDFYDVIAYNIAQKSPEYFFNKIKNYDVVRKRAAIFALGYLLKRDKRLFEILQDFILNDNNSMIISEAINALIHLENKNYWSSIQLLLSHQSPYVRGAVLKYARYAQMEEAYLLLVSSLTDGHYIVREAAVDELVELGDVKAIEKIISLVEDTHPDVREAAKNAIKELSTRNSD